MEPPAPHRPPLVTGFLDTILSAPAWTVLGIIALVVFAEDALFVGFVLPGETVAILGGVAAKPGPRPPDRRPRRGGPRRHRRGQRGLRGGPARGPAGAGLPVLRRRQRRLDDARDFLARRGGSAVFLGRWVAFFRAVMPALAGTARMPYPKFLAYNAAGGLAWGVAVVLAGYFAGASYTRVEKALGPGAAVVVVVAGPGGSGRVAGARAPGRARSAPTGAAQDAMLD